MIDHLERIGQYSSEITSRLHLLTAHVKALKEAPAPTEPEVQAKLWTELELISNTLRGLAEELETMQQSSP